MESIPAFLTAYSEFVDAQSLEIPLLGEMELRQRRKYLPDRIPATAPGFIMNQVGPFSIVSGQFPAVQAAARRRRLIEQTRLAVSRILSDQC